MQQSFHQGALQDGLPSSAYRIESPPLPILPHRYNISGDACPVLIDDDMMVSFRHTVGDGTISEQEASQRQ